MTPARDDPNQAPDPSAYQPRSNAHIAPSLDGSWSSGPGGAPGMGASAGIGGSAGADDAGWSDRSQSYGQHHGAPDGQQYGQPQYGPPQYGQPQYGQPQYGPPQYGQYGPPQGLPFPPPQGPAYAFPPPQGPAYAFPPPGYLDAAQPPGPVPPSKRRRTWKRRLIGVLIAVVFVAGGSIYGAVRSQSSPENAQPGDCIHYVSESDTTVVDCNSAKAQYRVESRIENKSSTTGCDRVEDSDVTLYSLDDADKPFTLCVSLVLRAGSCVSSEGDVVDCSNPDVTAKVTSVHQGTSDPNVCAPDELARQYTARPRVVCLEQIN